MRTSPDLREKIEQAAEANGRSLTQEVERRLITSFIFDDSRGGPHIGAFANMLCAAIQNIELDTGHRWMDDFDTFTRVRGAAERLLEWRNPGIENISRINDAEARRDEASARHAGIREELAAFEAPFRKPTGRVGLMGGGTSLSKDGWGEVEHQKHTDLITRERDAYFELQAAEEALGQLRDTAYNRMDRHEQAGREIADHLFDALGPRE